MSDGMETERITPTSGVDEMTQLDVIDSPPGDDERDRRGLTRIEYQAGRRRLLIRELAEGKRSQSQLAVAYGISRAGVAHFKRRHLDEITALQANIEDEFSGLYIARKEARIQEYEAELERIDADRAAFRMTATEATRARTRVLRQVAEEMGHLPSRVSVDVGVAVQVRYNLGGAEEL